MIYLRGPSIAAPISLINLEQMWPLALIVNNINAIIDLVELLNRSRIINALKSRTFQSLQA